MSKRGGKWVSCAICDAAVWASPSALARNGAGTGKHFCSREHASDWRYKTAEGRAYFSKKLREAAVRGGTKAANAASRGRAPWNKGLTAGTDSRVEQSAARRVRTYGGKTGLASAARRWMARHKRGPYATEASLPERQKVVLGMARDVFGKDRVAFEHFMLIGPDVPIFVDVAIPSQALAIEVDGTTHSTLSQMAKDAERDRRLKEMGWRVLRIKNDCVDQFPEAVRGAIEGARKVEDAK